MRRALFVALASCWTWACAAHVAEPAPPQRDGPPPNSVWWAPELGLDSASSVAQRLERPFEDAFDVVALVDGKAQSAVVPNCSKALDLVGQGYAPMSEGDAAAYQLEVAKCQVVKALETAKPAVRGSLAGFELDAGVLSVLPPALGPQPNPTDVEAREAATKAGTSWRAHDPEARVAAADARHAKVSGDGWTTELEILARADIDADGRDDILILALSYGTESLAAESLAAESLATGGSWRQVRLHQLSANEAQPVLQIVKRIPL